MDHGGTNIVTIPLLLLYLCFNHTYVLTVDRKTKTIIMQIIFSYFLSKVTKCLWLY